MKLDKSQKGAFFILFLAVFIGCSPKYTSEIVTVKSNQIEAKPFNGTLKTLKEVNLDTSQVVLVDKYRIDLMSIPRMEIGSISFFYNANLEDAKKKTLASILEEGKEKGASYYSVMWRSNAYVVYGEIETFALKME